MNFPLSRHKVDLGGVETVMDCRGQFTPFTAPQVKALEDIVNRVELFGFENRERGYELVDRISVNTFGSHASLCESLTVQQRSASRRQNLWSLIFYPSAGMFLGFCADEYVSWIVSHNKNVLNCLERNRG